MQRKRNSVLMEYTIDRQQSPSTQHADFEFLCMYKWGQEHLMDSTQLLILDVEVVSSGIFMPPADLKVLQGLSNHI